MGYGCLLDFAASCQLIRHVRLISGFCSSGYDFAIPSSRLHLAMQTLGVAMGFVGNYAPRGLSPQTDGMPVIQEKRSPSLTPMKGAAHMRLLSSEIEIWSLSGIIGLQIATVLLQCYSIFKQSCSPQHKEIRHQNHHFLTPYTLLNRLK